MELINIGFNSYISEDKIVSVLNPDSAPIRRLIQDAKDKSLLIDASFGRSTKSIILIENGMVVLSSLTPEEIESRIRKD